MVRKFKPSPKQASANRIRERYLHQLGLQRGAASASSQPSSHWDDHSHQNHVVVISGLPSLPEDRATNDNVLESHDFSHADGSYKSWYNEEGSNGGGGKPSSSAAIIGPPQQLYQPYPPRGDSSHCSRSTLSTSPHNHHYSNGNVADESMTSMALACPHSLLKRNQVNHHHNNNNSGATPNNSNTSSSALPFSLSWGTSQLSRSAAVLLDEAGGGPARRSTTGNDHDSVSSAATATTAESSFTATGMLSRDWASAATAATNNNNNVVAIPHPQSGTASVSSMGDSVTSAPTPGVFFQGRGNPSSTSASYASTGPAHCVATSSLASALNRFNIDSDCEASIASNSIMDDPTMMMDDFNSPSMDDCSASCASHISEGGGSSIASTTNTTTITTKPLAKKKNKKIGKNQRLLDRASAHERMMQMRSDRSQKLRANMVHSQRGLPMPHQLGGGGATTTTATIVASSPGRSCSSSLISQASSIPLMHVDHQATSLPPIMSTPHAAATRYLSPSVLLKHPPSFGGSDLGRTPTASNCSQHSMTTTNVLPVGVHSSYHLQGSGSVSCGPLNYHPQLVPKNHMPLPPSNVMVSSPPLPSSSLPSWCNTDTQDDPMSSNSSQVSEMETNLANVVLSLQHSTHGPPPPSSSPPPVVVKTVEESVEDDVMEVAVTLSMLGGKTSATPSNGGGGMIPRVR